MIYLLPVSHDVQLGKHNLSNNYKEFLVSVIPKLKISLVCEELSEDDVKADIHECIAKDVASKLGISYIHAEPTDKEREKLDIPLNEEIIKNMQNLILEIKLTGAYPSKLFEKFRQKMTIAHQKRELYWLNKIIDKKQKNVLFVVGIGHLNLYKEVHGEGFDKLLEKNNFDIKILPTDFVSPKYLHK